ncbi:MAG: NAD(P)-dependent oxidoreductase [Verrucomicrobiota bacterium]
MHVLLTGATGFVGSHILDVLRERAIPTVLLLRRASSRTLIQRHLANVTIVEGDLTQPERLQAAMAQATHVIHCAGLTKTLRIPDFYAINQQGTRNVVNAANQAGNQIQRFIHISSLAAAGPATPDHPKLESDTPSPVSHYGKSKLGGETEVRAHCHSPHTIIRPSAVYGPRDAEFLRLFKAVQAHLLPSFGGGKQALSLVYARDLALAVVHCLDCPSAENKTYFVAAPEMISANQMAAEVANQLHTWTLPLPLPVPLLYPVCAAQELISRLTGKANVLSRQKYAELAAPGWVCSAAKLKSDTGFEATTTFKVGAAATLLWYRAEQWMRC